VIDLLGDEQAHDLHERNLNGVGVFEDGEDEGRDAVTGAVGGEFNVFVLIKLVKVAEAVAAQGGRSALSAIDFDVMTAIGKTAILSTLPPSPRSIGIMGLAKI